MHLDTEAVADVSQGKQVFTIGNLCVARFSKRIRILENSAQKIPIFSAFSSKKMPASETSYGFLVAENHDLTRVFDGAKSTPAELLRETLSANIFVNVTQVSPHHLTVFGGSGRENISNPFLRINRAMVVQHGPMVVILG